MELTEKRLMALMSAMDEINEKVSKEWGKVGFG